MHWKTAYRSNYCQDIPEPAALLTECRKTGVECIFERIATYTDDSRERSLSRLVPELQPIDDDICIIKTADSAPNPQQYRYPQCHLLRKLH